MKITQKIDKIGKYELYMTPIQKDLVDNFSIQEGNMIYSRVLINGHFGTGKTYTLLLGIRRLVDLIQQKNDELSKRMWRSGQPELGCFFANPTQKKANSRPRPRCPHDRTVSWSHLRFGW